MGGRTVRQDAGGAPIAPHVVREWLTIHEACELIGVSPATLRRWSDAGEIRAFTTPGGHRRFARTAVLGLIPAERRERSRGRLGEIGERIGRVYRRIAAGTVVDADPPVPGGDDLLDRIPEGERGTFRELAASIALALVEHCDADVERREAPILRAEAAAAAFGALAAAHGASVVEAVDAFLAFRRPFLAELTSGACRHGFDARAATDLLGTATDAIDHLIAALVRGHQSGLEGPVVGAAVPAAGPARTSAQPGA
jgi:excisionase family DNA binding protein